MSFSVYRSSAGSGKTFTLVREYLKIILLEPKDFRHILAITFTNKAAAEMKERVLYALRQLSMVAEPADRKISEVLLPQLVRDTALTEPEIADRSARALRLILHNYSDFTIGTIDSFSHRVIRSFAHDFGLPVQFDVELDASVLLTTAVDLLIERVGTDDELTRFLVRFLEVRMDEDKGWNIERTLVDFSNVLLDEEGQDHIAELRSLSLADFTRITGVIQARIGSFEKFVREAGVAAMDLISKAGLESFHFYQGNKGIYKYFEYLATGRFDKLQPNTFVLTTIEEDKWAGGKSTPAEKSRIAEIKPTLQDYYQKIGEFLALDEETYMLNKLLAKTIYPLAVLTEVDRMMTEFKKQSNVIHISEFNRRIAAIVMHEPVPFIYERLGERYHHLMIDEFQDTSKMQWQNFIPLVENALAAGYFNLVVGDGKQAIYRFRNGDVDQFARLPKLEGADQNPIIRQRQQVLERHFSEEPLNQNFRSRKEIVEFNNRFFTYLSGVLDDAGKSVYRGLWQESEPKKSGGYIAIKLLDTKAEAMGVAELNYVEILRIIADAMKDGYAWKDMAILCRNNNHASNIARILIGEGIDVVSSESLLLTQSAEVNFLIAMIRFLFEQENPIILAEIAGYLLQTGRLTGFLWPEVLKRITANSATGKGLIRLLSDSGWDFRREALLSLPLYDLFEHVIRLFNLNRSADPYLQFFLDAVMAFMSRELNGAADFLKWWEENNTKLSVVLPDGLNAVRTMTIHKSKGLQFPVVIFPFASDYKKLTKGHLWTDLRGQNIPGLRTALLKTELAMEQTAVREQYREEDRKSMLDLVNLLYVVMTRPEDRLYIITTPPPLKVENMRSLPAFFAGFLMQEGLWQPEKFLYEYGTCSSRSTESIKTEEETRVLKSFISEEWRGKIRIRSLAPCLWDIENPNGKMQFGNQVHQLLAKINTREDAGPAIQEALMAGLISSAETHPIGQMIAAILDHPQIGPLYSHQVKVKTEAEILLPDGKVFRPDRVVFNNGVPAIVEYKTGSKDEKHIGQLEKYEKLMKAMGYPDVEKYLVYLQPEVEVIRLV